MSTGGISRVWRPCCMTTGWRLGYIVNNHVYMPCTHVLYVYRWNKQGVEALLYDDGLESGDLEARDRPHRQVTMSDLNEALQLKYEELRDKLLWEMANMATGKESFRGDWLHTGVTLGAVMVMVNAFFEGG
jgi:hypothetical protein